MAHRGTDSLVSHSTLYGKGRVSAQRAAIAVAAAAMPGAFTAEDLHRAVTAAEPGIGLATVYRAVGAMQSAGTVASVGERDGSTLLTVCVRHDHHHHLVCTECGAVVGVDCPIDETMARAAARDGHVVTHHEIVLYGLCAHCRAQAEHA